MFFEIVGEIGGITTIASGRSIRERRRLWKTYGKGRWRKKKGFAAIRLPDGTMWQAELHWYEAHGIGSKDSRSNGSSTKVAHSFMICVRNDEHAASLELRKLYETIPDSKASKLRLVRIIDESGQDYLYPEDYFVSVKLPQNVGRAVLRAAQ